MSDLFGAGLFGEDLPLRSARLLVDVGFGARAAAVQVATPASLFVDAAFGAAAVLSASADVDLWGEDLALRSARLVVDVGFRASANVSLTGRLVPLNVDVGFAATFELLTIPPPPTNAFRVAQGARIAVPRSWS